jgi:hypothetical protein
MVTNLVRFGVRMVKKVCNFSATSNELYRLPVLEYKQELTFVSSLQLANAK